MSLSRSSSSRLSAFLSPTVRLALLALTASLFAASCGFDEGKLNPVRLEGLPIVDGTEIETVIELEAPPGNVTVAPDGRVFFTFHPGAEPSIHVAEIVPGGDFEPFPNAAWQTPEEGALGFVSPLSLRADDRGRLWVLDHGDFGRVSPSLTAFDMASKNVVHRHEFPPEIAGRGSMLNDFWIDDKREIAYIADTSAMAFNPALIVYDIADREARRVLEDDPSVKPDDHHTVVQGKFLRVMGLPLRVAVDSIALSAGGETLFFGPMTGARMFRIDAGSLRDADLDEQQLADRVEEHGSKPSTDGIAADSDGNLYLTAIEDDSVWIVRPDGSHALLARDSELLSWPDGVHLSPDERFLYVTASELQHVLGADLEELPKQRPFRILRIPLGTSDKQKVYGTSVHAQPGSSTRR